jgi:hypothetical protein
MFGLDQSSGRIAKTTQRYPNIRFFLGRSMTISYPGVKLMRLMQSSPGEVIEHLYSPRRFVRRVHEALSLSVLGYAKNVMLALSNRMDRALTALWEGGHIKHWSTRTLPTLLGDARVRICRAFHGVGAALRTAGVV